MKYAAMEHVMPHDAQGIGVVSNDEYLVMVGFKTQREIITEIGYLCSDAGNDELHACMNALCERITGQPVIEANAPQVGALSEMLCDVHGFTEEEKAFAVSAELALKYAVRDYAIAAAERKAEEK